MPREHEGVRSPVKKSGTFTPDDSEFTDDEIISIVSMMEEQAPNSLAVNQKTAMKILGISKAETFKKNYPELCKMRRINKVSIAVAVCKTKKRVHFGTARTMNDRIKRILVRLMAPFSPDLLTVTQTAAMQILGIKKADTFRKNYPDLTNFKEIPKIALARAMTR